MVVAHSLRMTRKKCYRDERASRRMPRNLKSGLTSVRRLPQAGMACNKVPYVFGYWYAIDIAAGLNIFGDLVGNILDPVFKCVEGHDANRGVELAGQEIGDGRFKVVPFDLSFRAITA
jgi:hypothetical protein